MSSIIKYSGPVKIDFSSLTGKGAKIGIIDSGVCTRRFSYSAARVFEERASKDAAPDEIRDSIGHGTACAGIIRKIAPDADLSIAKVFHKDLAAPISALVSAIDWLADQNVNIINLSLGTVQYPSRLKALEKACVRAADAGITVVSANCNVKGKIAYPAGFDCVLGVDAGVFKKSTEFHYRPNGSPIELIAKGDRQVLDWVEPDSVYMGGTSFACPRISALVALMKELFDGLSPAEVRALLRENSIAEPPELVYDNTLADVGSASIQAAPELRTYVNPRKEFIRSIRKAVIYPYNKEMHSLIRYRHLLGYEISGVVDFIGKRTVGKDAAEVLGLPPCGITISARLDEKLDKADTLILGYVDELERITRRSIFGKCIRTAAEKGRRIYSLVPVHQTQHPELFEYLSTNQVSFCSPVVDEQTLYDLTTTFSPEEHSEKPIVAVFGTSPQQGKFTAQLALKEQLTAMGYKVGHLSTEHQGELLGADIVFPSGYSSDTNLGLPLDHHIPFLRSAIRAIEAQGVDITVCGAQSGIIPFAYGDFHSTYTLSSLAFLMGVLPDAAVMCVNTIDPDDFIRQCILCIESIGKTKVVALVFSDKRKLVRNIMNSEVITNVPMSHEEITDTGNKLESTFGIPALEIVSERGKRRLAEAIEAYLEG